MYCIFHSAIFGSKQERVIDSLSKLADSYTNDSLKSLVFIELASNYIGYDTVKCDRSLKQAYLIISDKKKWDYNWGYYYEVKSQVIFWLGEYARSLLLADSAIEFYKKSEQSKNTLTKRNAAFHKAVVISDKGGTSSMMGSNDNAIKFFLEGLQLYEKSDHPDKIKRIAASYNNIATLYYGLKQYEKSMEYDVKAIPFHLKSGDNESVAWAYIYAASDFSMLNQFDSAKIYFLKAEPHVKELNKPSVNIEYYGKTGGLYWTQKNWAKAIEYYTIAYDNAKKINDRYNQAGYLRGIGGFILFCRQPATGRSFRIKGTGA